MVNLVNALQCAGHTVASSRAEHGLSETLSVAMCSRADGAGGRCGAHTYSQILVLFLASVQVALVDSASTFGVPITRGIDVVGGASPISPPDDIASTTMSDTKKIRRKVRRKVKRRRKVSRSRSATSDAALDAATEQMHVSNAEETSTSTIPTLHSVSNGEESIAATSMRPTTAALVQDSAKNATDPSNLAFIGESLDSAAPTVPRKQQSPKKKTRKDPALAQRSGKANIVQDKKRAVGGGKEGECLRRIKREWKDAVALGIAYDWGKMKTVKRKGKKSSKSSTDPKYNYVRMGPMGKNLLSWHFSVQGAPNSVYAEGIYHGRVLLPKDYPASPPRVQMLTPSGRFVTGEDICLSASSYHPESWTPRWTVLSLIDALRLHMLTSANEIGGVHATNEVRKERAKESRTWRRGVVNHARMAEAGIFSLDDAESSSPYSTDCKENHTQPSLANAPSDEEILGMVTANAIQRHTERTARAMERRPSASKLFLLVKIVFRLTISVLTNPWKLALAIFTAIFAYLNSR